MDRITEIADLLDTIRRVRRSLIQPDLPASSPAAHYASLAKAERGATSLADRVVLVADLWTLISSEQAGGIAALLRADDGLVFSLFPLCRSIIEHSCAVIWVLDPDPRTSPENRCARAALFLDRTYEALCAAASHMGGKDSDAYRSQRERLKKHREAMEAEFPHGTDVRDGRVGGQRLASPTEILEHFGARWGDPREWRGIYEFLCATATHPGVAALEFFATHPDGGHMPTMSLDFLDRLIRATLAPLLKALEHYAMYCEWNMDALNEAIDRANEVFPDLLRESDSS